MVINIMVPQEKKTGFFKVKDRLSALSHFIGFLCSIVLTPVLLIKGALDGCSAAELGALSIFTLSMVLLYGASTAYHSFDLGDDDRNRRLRKLDHMMIPVLIAGTYTPLCVTTLRNNGGMTLLAVIWILALLSILFKAFRVNCPRFVSSVIYIAMGWACAPYLGALHSLLTPGGFRFLLLGGILYTTGGIIYATKLPMLERNREFRSHELFHLFILGGTLMHYLMVFSYVA
jgi:hemolysin III